VDIFAFSTSLGLSGNVSAKISSADKLLTASSRRHVYFAEQRVNERVTVLTHDQAIFIFGGKYLMEPDQTFKSFFTSVTDDKERMN
jgi:hypothetical protein